MIKHFACAAILAASVCHAKKPYEVHVAAYTGDDKVEVKFKGQFIHHTVNGSTTFDFNDKPSSVHIQPRTKHIKGDVNLTINWDMPKQSRKDQQTIIVYLSQDGHLKAQQVDKTGLTDQQQKDNNMGLKAVAARKGK